MVACGELAGASAAGETAHPAVMSEADNSKENRLIKIQLVFGRFFIRI
jgi:hypothetical protein